MRDIALQLYSVADACGQDFVGTLRRVRDMGYTAVEFAGYPLPPEEMKRTLEEIGLKPVSSHGNIGNIDAEIDYLTKVGTNHIVLPAYRFESYEHTMESAKWLEDVGKKLFEHGIALSYHNHTEEFQRDEKTGKRYMDLFLENCDPKYVKMQPDMAWVTRGGEDLVAFVERYKDRILFVHAKDITAAEGALCAVGSGCVKTLEALSIVPHAQIVVEQDGPLDDKKWADLEKSVAFLRKNLD